MAFLTCALDFAVAALAVALRRPKFRPGGPVALRLSANGQAAFSWKGLSPRWIAADSSERGSACFGPIHAGDGRNLLCLWNPTRVSRETDDVDLLVDDVFHLST